MKTIIKSIETDNQKLTLTKSSRDNDDEVVYLVETWNVLTNESYDVPTWQSVTSDFTMANTQFDILVEGLGNI